MQNIKQVCTEIVNGDHDNELESLARALRFRQDMLKEEEENELRQVLRVGQVVWFNQTTRPTYLIGAEAVVRKINRERIVVDLKFAQGRFSRGIRTSLSLITTVRPNIVSEHRTSDALKHLDTITSKDVGNLEDVLGEQQ